MLDNEMGVGEWQVDDLLFKFSHFEKVALPIIMILNVNASSDEGLKDRIFDEELMKPPGSLVTAEINFGE
jgi:hypothetical protein